jgi:hypothetical protein
MVSNSLKFCHKEEEGGRMITGQTNNTDGHCMQEKGGKNKWHKSGRK